MCGRPVAAERTSERALDSLVPQARRRCRAPAPAGAGSYAVMGLFVLRRSSAVAGSSGRSCHGPFHSR